MMAERELAVSHTTIMRWVLRYVPEYERRWARFARPPGSSWRMDETALSVRGGRHYLYRAVDTDGKSVASLLCFDRSMQSAQAFFRSAVARVGVPWPGKINLDGNKATHRALRLLSKKDCRWRAVEMGARRHLNNVIEQDHRAIKQRCNSMLGLKSFRSAAITLIGVELAHRIRKGHTCSPRSIGLAGRFRSRSCGMQLSKSRVHARLSSDRRRSANAPELTSESTLCEERANIPAWPGPVRAEDSAGAF